MKYAIIGSYSLIEKIVPVLSKKFFNNFDILAWDNISDRTSLFIHSDQICLFIDTKQSTMVIGLITTSLLLKTDYSIINLTNHE